MANRFNILYVDDEADNLFAFRSVFRRYFNVFTALNGLEAIELLKEQSIHLVLSDQRMPHMTGVELCSFVMENYPSAVRLIVTGYSEMKPIHDAIETGKVNEYVMKPWNVENLKQVIDQALHVNIQ